jgi:hypothetical protein
MWASEHYVFKNIKSMMNKVGFDIIDIHWIGSLERQAFNEIPPKVEYRLQSYKYYITYWAGVQTGYKYGDHVVDK